MAYLKRPSPLIKLLEPNLQKLQDFGAKLLNNYLYIPDEFRNEDGVSMLLAYYFPHVLNAPLRPFSVWYELGAWGGVLGFVGIIPGHKCSIVFKLWDKSLWGATLYRGLMELPDRFMKEYALKRLDVATADERMMRVAKRLGFRVEGTQALEFAWKKKLYTKYLLRKVIREEEE